MNWMILIIILFAFLILIIMVNAKLSIIERLKYLFIAFLPFVTFLLLKIFIVISRNKYFKTVIKFIFNYMNLMTITGTIFSIIMFTAIILAIEGLEILDRLIFLFISFLPMPILLFFKFLTMIFKNKCFFIIISIISTIYIVIYGAYVFYVGLFFVLFPRK